MRCQAVVALVVASLALVPASAAKIGPDGVRVCGADRCVTLTDTATLRKLNAFVYGGTRLTGTAPPKVGTPVFALELGGLFGGPRLDRFRSNGIVCGRFRRGRWYRVPDGIARELRRVTAKIEPRRLIARVPRSC